MTWKPASKAIGSAKAVGKGAAKVVHLTRPKLLVKQVHIATPTSTGEFEYLYLNGNTHAIAPGDLAWWARGAKITTAEWVAGRAEDQNLRACVLRNKGVAMLATIALDPQPTAAVTGKLTAKPTLDGAALGLTAVTVDFTYPANTASYEVVVKLGGQMPDEVGRYVFKIAWSATGTDFTCAAQTSKLFLYSVYERPFKPDYDSAISGDAGQHTSTSDGTLSGTPKRLDKLMSILSSTKRHKTATADNIISLLWKLHVGINDTPGAAPYFDAGHDEYLTDDGTSSGTDIPLEDQWLAWITTADPHWNDASCIGHVQILKTMAAAVGFFARRTWIFPTTSKLPDGTTPVLADTDCYCLGTYDSSKQQKWTFTHAAKTYVARPKLMEPSQGWENFEACLRSPNGKFLPGGYNTSQCPQSVRTQKGFASAKELIKWWSGTSRTGFGKRFMCWVAKNTVTGDYHCWDVDGKHYALADYVKIRTSKKELPPP